MGRSSSHPKKPDLSSAVDSPIAQIYSLQRTLGNRGVERLLRSETIQTKLKINEPGDSYEQEADRISDQVLRAPAQTRIGATIARIQRTAGHPAGETATAPASVDHAVTGVGQPLDPALREEMEQRLGGDFSRVRVHTGPVAEQSARDVNARAYTVGRNLVFGEGEFKPGTPEGRRLLAHELTHVVQQSGSAAASTVRRQFDDDEPTIVDKPRQGPRGHVERAGEIYPGNVASGEINTGGRPGSGGSGGGTSGGGGGGGASKVEKARHFAGKSGTATTTTATKSSAKTAGTAERAGTKAVVKAEETAIKAETKLGSRMAKGVGRFGLSTLLPGPEDAIMLMADFAGSYLEAWEIIEQRNTRRGIAMGIAAGMMGLDWGWVQQNVWRRFATPDVATQVIAAVGKAERSYNDGLVRGHKYGAGHSQRLKNRFLGEAFSVLAQEGYMTDEAGLFSIDTVARVARVLMPLADDFLRQAAERKEARERREAEQRRKESREWGSVGFKV